MSRCIHDLAGAILALATVGSSNRADENASGVEKSLYGQFVGSSPCGESIQRLLQIPADAKSELMQWNLTLNQNPQTKAPAGYILHCDYGSTVPGSPGLGKTRQTIERKGRWKVTKGTKSNP